MVFEKNLTDLIRCLRANKNYEKKYIQKAILECQREVKSQDLNIKTMAILKLAYLTMFGYDMSWASFNIIEVMSSRNFFQKRIGYMASCLSFCQNTDMLMLSTNLIKKDLMSSNSMDIGITINALSEIVTPELSRDIFHDLCTMMNHSNPYIRKKVVLVMYKIFLQYPDALKSTFVKLCEKLEDEDQSVVCATVNVICELSMKNPKNYLQLVPILYNLLKTSSNNWMLIKLIKIFLSMISLEPRLIKKLVPVLTSLIQNTSSMSLRYECINIIVSGNFLKNESDSSSLTTLCISKLRTFFEDTDKNLKYLGMLALSKVMFIRPTLVLVFENIILECLQDDDINIRLRALDLIECLVNRENLSQIIKYLMIQLLLPFDSLLKYYRIDLVNKILAISSKDSYINISDFDWYISVLVDLVRISKVNVAEVLGNEMQNVSVRVKIARSYAVKRFSVLLYDLELINSVHDSETNIGVLSYVAWIVGEYSNLLDSYYEILESMLQPKVLNFPISIQKIYMQAIPKVFINWILKQDSYWGMERNTESLMWVQKIISFLDIFCISKDLEVSQRALEFREFFKVMQSIIERAGYYSSFDNMNESLCFNQFSNISDLVSFFLANVLSTMFLDKLNPVAPKAQKKIPVLEDIDMENWIYSPPKLCSDYDFIFFDDELPVQRNMPSFNDNSFNENSQYNIKKKDRFNDDSFYISGDIVPSCRSFSLGDVNELNNIPIVKLEILNSFEKKERKDKENIQVDTDLKSIEIISDEIPENVVISDSENENISCSLSNKLSKSILHIDTTALQKFSMDEENSIELLNRIEEIKKTLKDSKVSENKKKSRKGKKDKNKKTLDELSKCKN